MKHFFSSLLVTLFAFSASVSAAVFQVSDIRIEGLQRVSAGTVFAALPISVGDLVDEPAIREATRSLFRTGYFSDIVMARENGVLVIAIAERPAVTEIVLDGNKAIETEQLMTALRDNGLAEGQIFRQVILEGMVQELQRQYVSQGRYGALVETEVKQLPRNWVSVNINIDEGDEPEFAISILSATTNSVKRNCWNPLSLKPPAGFPGLAVMTSMPERNSRQIWRPWSPGTWIEVICSFRWNPPRCRSARTRSRFISPSISPREMCSESMKWSWPVRWLFRKIMCGP